VKREQVKQNGFSASFIESDGIGWMLGSCESPPLGSDVNELDRYRAFFEGLVDRLKELQSK
jgi:hypothetical protein